MRVFIALPVPDAIAAHLAGIGLAMAGEYAGLNPARPDGMHLTLAFLGEQTEARAEKLGSLFEQDAFASDVIRASVSGIGTFPPTGQPRVIWAGLARGEQEIIDYQKRVMQLLVTSGFPEADEGREYHPHLTIARNKFATIPRERLGELKMPMGEFDIVNCALFQSVLGPKGATYTQLAKRHFGRKKSSNGS